MVPSEDSIDFFLRFLPFSSPSFLVVITWVIISIIVWFAIGYLSRDGGSVIIEKINKMCGRKKRNMCNLMRPTWHMLSCSDKMAQVTVSSAALIRVDPIEHSRNSIRKPTNFQKRNRIAKKMFESEFEKASHLKSIIQFFPIKLASPTSSRSSHPSMFYTNEHLFVVLIQSVIASSRKIYWLTVPASSLFLDFHFFASKLRMNPHYKYAH